MNFLYKSPDERMKTSLRRNEVESTGKPIYIKYKDVPEGLYSKTQCKSIGKPITQSEEPDAYVLNRLWNGYLGLYRR